MKITLEISDDMIAAILIGIEGKSSNSLELVSYPINSSDLKDRKTIKFLPKVT